MSLMKWTKSERAYHSTHSSVSLCGLEEGPDSSSWLGPVALSSRSSILCLLSCIAACYTCTHQKHKTTMKNMYFTNKLTVLHLLIGWKNVKDIRTETLFNSYENVFFKSWGIEKKKNVSMQWAFILCLVHSNPPFGEREHQMSRGSGKRQTSSP